jgi:hypothetical protein
LRVKWLRPLLLEEKLFFLLAIIRRLHSMKNNLYQKNSPLPAWLLAVGGLLATPALAQTPTFAPVVTYPTGAGTNPYHLAVADVNGDGKPDALTSLQQAGQIGVQLGNGDGTFRAVATYASGDKTLYKQTLGIAVADINADTRPDVLVVNKTFDAAGAVTSSVGVLLGNGDGTFRDVVPYLTGAGTEPRELVVADVNRDGRLDAVVSDVGAIVLLGNGDGTFQAAVPYSAGAGSFATDVAVGDVNFDFLPDIVIAAVTPTGSATAPYTYSVKLLLGKGSGTFEALKSISTTSSGRIRIAEVLGGINGGADIVTSSAVLAGDGKGNFYAVPYPAGTIGGDVAASDVNGDGFADVLTADYSGAQVALLLNNSGNSLQAAGTFSTGPGTSLTSVVVADVNGDGRRDVLAAGYGNNSIGVLLNTTVLPTSFAYTGSPQTYTVPAGVTRLTVVATGGNGGLLGSLGSYVYTSGAQAKATVTVTPGEVLTVVVGGAGSSPFNARPSDVSAGGYNGGGRGIYTGTGGGGATDLRRDPARGRTDDYLASRNALVVAGGGGGSDQDNSGDSFPGSSGGAPAGYPASYSPASPAGSFSAAGGGASQTGPGSGSNAGVGSNGGDAYSSRAATFAGSGGSGGYYGGGAGAINMGFANSRTSYIGAGGGGGSSFVSPTGSTDITYSTGNRGASLTILPITPLATAPVDLVVTTTTTIAAGTYSSITVNSPGVATLTGDVTVTGSVTVNSGATLNDGCAVISGAGSFTLAAGGTLGICNAAGISSSSATGAVQTTGTRSFSTDASYVYNGTAAQSTGSGLPAQVRNLSTTNAATVTLAAPTSVAQVLTVGAAGNLATTSVGQLTLLSAASGTALLVNSGTGVVTGTATVQRYIDPSKNAGSGYRHFAAPVSNTTLADLATSSFTPTLNPAYNNAVNPGAVTPFPTVFSYDQAQVARTTAYSPFDRGFFSPQAATAQLVPGRGYTVQIGPGQLVDFVGSLNQAPVQMPAVRNEANTLNSSVAGWQFLGNPYPSPIDFNKFSPDDDYPGLDASIYVQESSGPYTGSYRAYVNGVGTSPLIASSQSFFMRKTAPGVTTVTFRNNQRVTTFDAQSAFYRTAADPRPRVELALSSTGGPADAFYAYAEAGATAGFDSKYDAWKLANASGLNLASASAGGEALSIDGRAAFTPATTIALTVGVPAAGTYTLAAASLANLPAGLDAYLTDAQTGYTTKLSPGTSYAFSVSASEAPATLSGRFGVRFSAASPLAAVAGLTAAAVSVYPNPTHGRFAVALPGVASATQVQAELLNTLGQVVRRQSASLPAGGTQLTIEATGLAVGVYTLRLQAGSSTLTKRLVIN